jgi:hypothetical protein
MSPARSSAPSRTAPRIAPAALMKRVPFTLSVVAVMLITAAVTGALWTPLHASGLVDHVAYGLPALEDGRWWTPVTGSVFALVPLQYVPVAGGFLLLVGFAELRLGTRRTLPLTVLTQLAGVLGATALLWLTLGSTWPWADENARVLDVGFSAGALGAAAAATATLASPWRGRLRAGLLAYAVVSFVYIGALWDLEHLLAVALGLAVGPRLVGRRIDLRARSLSRHEYRLLASGAFVVSAAAAGASSLASSGGPLTVGLDDTESSLTSGLVFVVLWLVVANGLRSGRRRAWRWAVGLTVASLALLVAVGIILAVDGHPGWPLVTYTALLTCAQLAVLVLGRRAFRNPTRRRALRTALNQAAKQGLTHRLVPLAKQPRGVQVQVRAISEQWVGDKGLPEMGFTLGGLEEAMDPDVRVGLAVDADGTVHGVTSWMPAYAPGGGEARGWTLDVMRRLPGGFRHTMEFLIASACLEFQDEGAEFVSLSGVPLARTGDSPDDDGRGVLDTFLDTLGSRLEPYYGFRSLQAFKSKFQPSHAPLYLVFPDEAALPRIGLALSRAYLPEAGVRDLISLTRSPHLRSA